MHCGELGLTEYDYVVLLPILLSRRCHNHDFVEVALDIRQMGEEAAMSEMEMILIELASSKLRFEATEVVSKVLDCVAFSENLVLGATKSSLEDLVS
ncbi:hypothetical protein Tco_0803599 [Tanacetum coccineum]|uniref:Uncharacterized protein n=1 Tax=Tanacetum coccineum TaxID=301880 RepID=A0ABQ5A4S1_9ASTR